MVEAVRFARSHGIARARPGDRPRRRGADHRRNDHLHARPRRSLRSTRRPGWRASARDCAGHRSSSPPPSTAWRRSRDRRRASARSVTPSAAASARSPARTASPPTGCAASAWSPRTGEIVTADDDTNSDLFWALRGGKGGLAVVTEMTLELVPLRSLYGGSVFFEGDAIEPAFRAWIDWSAELPDEATTSVALLSVPDMEGPPPPLRGRTVLSVRFAYPGDTAEGETSVRADPRGGTGLPRLRGRDARDRGREHPQRPGGGRPDAGSVASCSTRSTRTPAMSSSSSPDPAPESPFLSVEIRQIGGATARDTATAPRSAAATAATRSVAPRRRSVDVRRGARPRVRGAIADALGDRISAVTNVNWSPATSPTGQPSRRRGRPP